jgi:hypothetical protein
MITIYVLKCENDKYYIGSTSRDVSFRVFEHFNECGSEWTKIYKPIEVIETVENCDMFDEDKYTKIYMNKYGIWNVRGGSYTMFTLNESQKQCLQQELRHCNNCCYICGINTHMSFNCSNVLQRQIIHDD